MSSNHTDGLLHLAAQVDTYLPVRAEDGLIVADVGFRELEVAIANGRRIVACWNACIGIPNGILDAGGSVADAVRHFQQQRDELRMALEFAMPALEAIRKQHPRNEHDDSVDVLAVAKATLAKVGP